ncbi:MAG: hypothetical protein N2559_04940 [Anaerolineae bacterium]|nr:hypothetical protein [Anaerolineae bacterium]
MLYLAHPARKYNTLKLERQQGPMTEARLVQSWSWRLEVAATTTRSRPAAASPRRACPEPAEGRASGSRWSELIRLSINFAPALTTEDQGRMTNV